MKDTLSTLFASALGIIVGSTMIIMGSVFLNKAHADEYPNDRGMFLGVQGPSYHTVTEYADHKRFNNDTPGVFVGYRFDHEVNVRVGGYKNSFYKPSFYVEADYLPIGYNRFRFGAGFGLVTGYRGEMYDFAHSGITPGFGLLATYRIEKKTHLELRVLPLYANVTGQPTKYGAVFNMSISMNLY